LKTNISFLLSGLTGILMILLMTPISKADDFLTDVSYSRQVGVQVDRSQSGATDVSSVFSGTILPATGSIYTDGPVAGAFASANYNFTYDGTQASFQGTTNFNVIGEYSSYTEGLCYTGPDNSNQNLEPGFFTLNQSATYSIQTSGSSTFNTSFPQGGMVFQIWEVNATSPTVSIDDNWNPVTGILETTNPVTSMLDPGNYYFIEYNFGSLYSGNLRTIGGANLAGTTNFAFDINDSETAATPEPGSRALLVGMGVTGVGLVLRRRKTRGS
jgi:hypothetical protein